MGLLHGVCIGPHDMNGPGEWRELLPGLQKLPIEVPLLIVVAVASRPGI